MTDPKHFDDWLLDYVDGTLDQVRSETFRRHLKRCSECRTTVESYEKARDAYRKLDGDGPSAAVSAAILRQSRAFPTAPRVWRRPAWLASAAMLLLALAVFAIRESKERNETIPSASTCQELRKEGAQLSNEGQPREALAKYAEATGCDPASPLVGGDHHQQGLLFVELGELDHAIEKLRVVLDRYPDYERRSEVILETADIMKANGNMDDALAAYRQYADEYPANRAEAEQRIEAMQLSEELREHLGALGYVQ